MIAYFDTSALIKLIIEEEGSDLAEGLWDAADSVLTSRLTYPEARAAFARGRRAGRITEAVHSAAKSDLRSRLEQIRILDLTEEIAREAGDLAELYRLRGHDAVHLASATATRHPELVVATWDLALRRAVIEVGIAVAGAGSR